MVINIAYYSTESSNVKKNSTRKPKAEGTMTSTISKMSMAEKSPNRPLMKEQPIRDFAVRETGLEPA